MPSEINCRRLQESEVERFQALRIEAFAQEPRAFRFAPEDEAHVPLADVAARLQRDFVVGAYHRGALVGVGGLAYGAGVKTHHKALLYGMYVKAAYRGGGASNAIMERLIDEARRRVELVTLSVVSEIALRFAFTNVGDFAPTALKNTRRRFQKAITFPKL